MGHAQGHPQNAARLLAPCCATDSGAISADARIPRRIQHDPVASEPHRHDIHGELFYGCGLDFQAHGIRRLIEEERWDEPLAEVKRTRLTPGQQIVFWGLRI
jgi:hypothetical protein